MKEANTGDPMVSQSHTGAQAAAALCHLRLLWSLPEAPHARAYWKDPA